MKKTILLWMATAFLAVAGNAQGTFAVGEDFPVGTAGDGYVVSSVANCTLTLGVDHGWKTGKTSFGDYSYYVVGTQNPKDGGFNEEGASAGGGYSEVSGNLPNAGTYYVFKPASDGTISAALKVGGNKSLFVVDGDGTNVTATAKVTNAEEDYAAHTDGSFRSATGGNSTLLFPVEGGKTYYVFCTGSKLSFFGFTYEAADSSSDSAPDARWTFDDASNLLKADKGDLTMLPIKMGTKTVEVVDNIEAVGITAIAGKNASDGAAFVPKDAGFKVERTKGTTSQDYTILMDVKVDDANAYNALYQTNVNNTNDGDMFFHDHMIGINLNGLGYHGEIKDNTWYRIAILNRDGDFCVYVDGELVSHCGSLGCWELDPWGFYLFCDESGETVDTYVSEINFWERGLSDEEVAALSKEEESDVFSMIAGKEDLVAGGKYLLAYPLGDGKYCFYSGIAEGKTFGASTAEAVVTDYQVVAPEGAVVLTLEGEDGAWKFKEGDMYFYWQSGNSLSLDATGARWNIIFMDNAAVITDIDAEEVRELQYNVTSPRFACYKGTQKAPFLFKAGEVTTTPGEVVVPEYESLGELCKVTPTEKGSDVIVTLTDEEIADIYVTSQGYRNGIYLNVGDRQIEIFCYDVPEEWEVGGKVSGTIQGVWKDYKGTWEVCPANWDALTYTAPAPSFSGDEIGDGFTGYFLNVATNTYMTKGNNYGTTLSRGEKDMPVTLDLRKDNGMYKLFTNFYPDKCIGWDNGSGFYVDITKQATTYYVISPVDKGNGQLIYTIYAKSIGEKGATLEGYLAAKEENTIVTSQETLNEYCYWQFEFKDAKALVEAAIAKGENGTPYVLQTTDANAPYYLWTNAQEPSEGPIRNIIDGNYQSFFHSMWSTDIEGPHYLFIDMGEGNNLTDFAISYRRRTQNNNNRPTEIIFSGSNDGTTYTDFATLTQEADGLPTDANVNSYVSKALSTGGTAYRYLRIYPSKNNSNSKFFTFGEFALLAPTPQSEDVAAAIAAAKEVLANEAATKEDCLNAVEAIEKAVYKATATLKAGTYFMKNKSNGKYITGGLNWGTRAAFIDNFGIDFNVSVNNGVYTLGTFTNHSLRDTDGFTDQAGTWSIEPTDEYNTYTVKGSAGYLGDDGSNAVAVNLADGTTDAAKWIFLTKEQMLEEALKDASAEHPADLSFLIQGRNFSRSDVGDFRHNAWVPTGILGFGGLAGKDDTTWPNSFSAEIWNKEAVSVSQTITGLPDGYYQLKVFGYYRMGSPADHANHMVAGDLKKNAYFALNDTKAYVPFVSDEAKEAAEDGWPTAYTAADGTVMMYGPDQLSHAVVAFAKGGYQNTITTHVAGGKITITAGKEDFVPYDWFVMDEFQLFYLGNTPTAQAPESGVYYLYNPKTGKFLTRGNNWGTRAMLNDYAVPVKVESENGQITLRDYAYQNDIIGWASDTPNYIYCDKRENGTYITTPVEGGYILKNIAKDGYVQLDENNNLIIEGEASTSVVFDFWTVSEYEAFVTAREQAATFAAAKAAGMADTYSDMLDSLKTWSTIDCTEAVKSHTLINGTDGWTWDQSERNGSTASNGNATERWQTTGRFWQTVTGLEPGFYAVTIEAYQRPYHYGDGCYDVAAQGYNMVTTSFEANGNKVRIVDWAATTKDRYPDNMGDGKRYLDEGNAHNVVYGYVGEDGNLTIALYWPAYYPNCWSLFENVTLKRYVQDPFAVLRAAIANAATVDTEAPQNGNVAAELRMALEEANAILDVDVTASNASAERVNAAVAAAKQSIEDYAKLAADLALYGPTYVEGASGAADFLAVFEKAKANYDNRVATAADDEELVAAFNAYLAANEINFENGDMNDGLNGWDTYAEKNAWGHNHWQTQGASYTNGNVSISNFIECWGANTAFGTAYAQRKLEGLPAGKYVLTADIIATCQGKANNKGDVTNSYLFLNDDQVFVATNNGAPEHFMVISDVTADTILLGYKAVESTVDWVSFDNVHLYTFNPDFALAEKLAEAKALLEENPDVNGEAKAHLVAEVNAANNVEGLAEAIAFFKSAIDVYNSFAALERQYDKVALLADANKAALTALGSATLPLDDIYAAYEAYKQAVYDYNMLTVSVDNPVDQTELYIINPSFETGDLTGWTISNTAGDQGVYPNTNGTYTMQPIDGMYMFNSWNGDDTSYTLAQTISLPKGFYKLTALVVSHDGHDVTMYAGENTVTTTCYGGAGKAYPAELYFQHEGGDIAIGILGGWFYKVDNFHLYYMGVRPKTVGYFTLAGKEMAEGASDPIYAMLAADPKIKVVYNEVAADATPDLSDYDAVVVQESFGGKNAIVTTGALSIYNTEVPMLFNKTYALGADRGTATGSRADAQNVTTIDVVEPISGLFNGIDGTTIPLYYGLATDLGEEGTKGLSYVSGINEVPEKSLGAVPTGVTNASLAFSDIHAGDRLDGKTTQARVLIFGMNYGSLCREGGKYLSDEAYTMWRNAVYMLLGMYVPREKVDMDINDEFEVAGVSLDQTNLTVGQDETITLTATVTPETAANKGLVWTSSNEDVATVVDGVVTTNETGEADITVTTVDGGYKATCHITVVLSRFHTYDFRHWTDEQKDALATAVKNKEWTSLSGYFKTGSALKDEPLMAGTLNLAEGLLWTVGSGNLRVYTSDVFEDNYIYFNAASTVTLATENVVVYNLNGEEFEAVPVNGVVTLEFAKKDQLYWIQITDVNGIEEIELDRDMDGTIYNVAGQRVEEPVKGNIYIVNGRKVIVK